MDALRWIQETLDVHEEPVHELSFGPDKPGLLMRRTLLRLSNLEQPALRVIPVHPAAQDGK